MQHDMRKLDGQRGSVTAPAAIPIAVTIAICGRWSGRVMDWRADERGADASAWTWRGCHELLT